MLGAQELANHFDEVPVFAVHRIVQPAHLLIGDFPAELIERFPNLRMALERLAANHGHGLIRGEVVLVVLQDGQVAGGDQAVGGVARHQVNLLLQQRAVKQAQVHNARGLAKREVVSLRKPR